MIYKKAVRYLAILIVTTIGSGTLLFMLDPLLVNDDNNNMQASIGFAFVFIFATYNIYLLVSSLVPLIKNANWFKQGLFCLLLENLLWFILLDLFAGFNSGQFILNLLGVSLLSFFIPYLHKFLNSKLGIASTLIYHS